MKREERNAREKERSFRISRQINELRDLLSTGGVIVPKGTKSSVLTEAANYIRMLQQHQYRSEIDRHQLVQQIQMIGGGALGQQAATAVRHVAAQNGVWSLGNFGGVPPKSASMYHQPGALEGEPVVMSQSNAQPGQDDSAIPNKIEEGDYRHIFNSCTVGMAIASMGGAFIDCNKLFCQLSNHSKQEVCSMTVFNLTYRQDLQPAFDLISQMLSSPSDASSASTSCVLRGAFKHRDDLGLNVTLIKGEDGVAKCFCVTLILNPASPYDTSRPIPATIELVGLPPVMSVNTKQSSQAGLDPSPAYTAG
jgi:PAS domain-containing protein